jgi:hypothetical protein
VVNYCTDLIQFEAAGRSGGKANDDGGKNGKRFGTADRAA